MILYCLKGREKKKKKEGKNPRVAETNKRKPVLVSKHEKCDSKKSRFIINQDASVLTLLGEILMLSDILF